MASVHLLDVCFLQVQLRPTLFHLLLQQISKNFQQEAPLFGGILLKSPEKVLAALFVEITSE